MPAARASNYLYTSLFHIAHVSSVFIMVAIFLIALSDFHFLSISMLLEQLCSGLRTHAFLSNFDPPKRLPWQ